MLTFCKSSTSNFVVGSLTVTQASDFDSSDSELAYKSGCLLLFLFFFFFPPQDHQRGKASICISSSHPSPGTAPYRGGAWLPVEKAPPTKLKAPTPSFNCARATKIKGRRPDVSPRPRPAPRSLPRPCTPFKPRRAHMTGRDDAIVSVVMDYSSRHFRVCHLLRPAGNPARVPG